MMRPDFWCCMWTAAACIVVKTLMRLMFTARANASSAMFAILPASVKGPAPDEMPALAKQASSRPCLATVASMAVRIVGKSARAVLRHDLGVGKAKSRGRAGDERDAIPNVKHRGLLGPVGLHHG
jgi:hypothetical protein